MHAQHSSCIIDVILHRLRLRELLILFTNAATGFTTRFLDRCRSSSKNNPDIHRLKKKIVLIFVNKIYYCFIITNEKKNSVFFEIKKVS